MKQTILLTIILLLSSCTKEIDITNTDIQTENDIQTTTVPVTVSIDDFSIEQEEYSTRATETVANFTNVKAITLAFYTDEGDELYQETQLRADNSNYTTFGVFELELPMGSYSMVVLGYGSTSPITLNSKTEAIYPTSEHVRETYIATQDVDIETTTPVNLNASLNRVNSSLAVTSTDDKTANATNLRMTFSKGGRGVNPQNGLATTNTGFNNTTTLSNYWSGNKTISTSHLFLASDEQEINVTLDVLDAEGTSISHKVINNVPFKRNRRTRLIGSLYTATSSSATFTIVDEPLTDYELDF